MSTKNIYRDNTNDRWQVKFVVDGKNKVKHFTDKKHGSKQKSFEAAEKWRKRMVRKGTKLQIRLKPNPETGYYGIGKLRKGGNDYFRIKFLGNDKCIPVEDGINTAITIRNRLLYKSKINNSRISKWLEKIQEPVEDRRQEEASLSIEDIRGKSVDDILASDVAMRSF